MEPSSDETRMRMDIHHGESSNLTVFAIAAAGIGAWKLEFNEKTMIWDECCSELFGFTTELRIPVDTAFKNVHPEDALMVKAALDNALAGVQEGKFDIRCRVILPESSSVRWISFSGRAFFDQQSRPLRMGGAAKDITRRTELALQSDIALQQSESRLRAIHSAAPAAIALFVGRELIIEMPNQAFIDIVGKGPDISGKALQQLLPELYNQTFLTILDDVYTSGKMFRSFGAPATLVKDGVSQTNYYDVTFSPMTDDQGKVYAILDISLDVTEAVLAR